MNTKDAPKTPAEVAEDEAKTAKRKAAAAALSVEPDWDSLTLKQAVSIIREMWRVHHG